MSTVSDPYVPSLTHPDPANIGPVGGQQVVYYTGVDPNTDGVKPVNQDAPAIAVPPNGVGTWYDWNQVTKVWN